MSSPTIPQKLTMPLLLAAGVATAYLALRRTKGDEGETARPPRVGAVAQDVESSGPARGHRGGVTYGDARVEKSTGEPKGT